MERLLPVSPVLWKEGAFFGRKAREISSLLSFFQRNFGTLKQKQKFRASQLVEEE